jgi:hypothetical protein
MKTFLIVAGTILITSLLTACFIVGGIEYLYEKFNKENVSVEQKIGYNEIDVAVKDGNEFIFYEVKVASSLKRVIREALGQLMEYSYYGATKIAKKLVIVSDYPLDEKNKAYLESKGVDTSTMTYIQILKANTGSRVLLDGVCSPTDAMEDLDLGMYLFQALQAE